MQCKITSHRTPYTLYQIYLDNKEAEAFNWYNRNGREVSITRSWPSYTSATTLCIRVCKMVQGIFPKKLENVWIDIGVDTITRHVSVVWSKGVKRRRYAPRRGDRRVVEQYVDRQSNALFSTLESLKIDPEQERYNIPFSRDDHAEHRLLKFPCPFLSSIVDCMHLDDWPETRWLRQWEGIEEKYRDINSFPGNSIRIDPRIHWAPLCSFWSRNGINYRSDAGNGDYLNPNGTGCGDCEDMSFHVVHSKFNFDRATFKNPTLQELQKWSRKYCLLFSMQTITSGEHAALLCIPKSIMRDAVYSSRQDTLLRIWREDIEIRFIDATLLSQLRFSDRSLT